MKVNNMSQNNIIDNKYEILRKIGEGGMSKVYLAMDIRLNKQWAVKEIARSGLNDKMKFQSALAEVNMIKRLDHPALPRIVDIIQQQQAIYVVMDYIEGEPLDKLLEGGRGKPQEIVIDWAKQLCRVLNYLHKQNPAIIYRDMKPANIMLKPDGQLKLIDFGIAREYKEEKLGDTVNLGTRGYAAPEQFGKQGQTDARTDIYCLGMTLYHLLTGRSPAEELYGIVPIREVNPMLSNGLEKIVLKCTESDPNKRYQSCEELLVDLEQYDKIDDKYIANEKKKLKIFGATMVSTVFALGIGVSGQLINSSQVNANYEAVIQSATLINDNSNEQKINKFIEAIHIKPLAHEGYYELINTIKKDAYFTVEEEAKLKILLNDYLNDLSQTKNFAALAFEIGKLYWFYYAYGDENTDDNQLTRIRASKRWFDIASENEAFDNQSAAKIYRSIAQFHEEITLKIEEASDAGMYKNYWESLVELESQVAANESDIVRLETFKLIISSIELHARKFAGDQVPESDLKDVITKIQQSLGQMDVNNSDKAVSIKQYIEGRFDAVNLVLETVYEK